MRHQRLLFVLVSFAVTNSLLLPWSLHAQTVEELRQQLEQKHQNLKSAEDRMTQFKTNIQLKQTEARTLQDQISIIDDSLQELSLDIEHTGAQIEQIATEIQQINNEIAQKEQQIAVQKVQLAAYIRALNDLDRESTIVVFFKYQTFSQAVSDISTYEQLQSRSQQTLVAIQQLRDELAVKQRELQDYQQSLQTLQQQQEDQQKILQDQRDSKKRILELTNAQENHYQSLLQQEQQSHTSAEQEIKNLDAALREELQKQGGPALTSIGHFDWPIEPAFGVSCEFHCTDYPFAYLIGPHAGMDIPTYVGTPIKAPADGYIGRLHDSGGPGYSYILMIFGDDLSVVFGHVSGFASVHEGQFVHRGDIIGYTGGAAGMHGAGLSSGPHLHFEVRLHNTPVNPRNYL